MVSRYSSKFVSVAPLPLVFALIWGVFLSLGCEPAYAVKLSGLFSDHMVVQRERPLLIWGKAKAAEKIQASIGGQSREAVADSNGDWQVAFDDLAVGGPYELKVQGENSISVKDILSGDVFLCAGQSNMVFPVSRMGGADTIYSEAQINQLRLFSVPRKLAERPSSMVDGAWQVSSAKSAADFSAIAYLFAKQVQARAKVPVGVIDCSYSGTPIDAWMSPASLNKIPTYRTIFTSRSYLAKVKGNSLADFNSRIGKPDVIDNSNLNVGFVGGNGASLVYNAMVAPLIGFPLRGICWYQGEADLGQASKYGKLFCLLIADWRRRWHDENDIPFYFVQLPSCQLYSDSIGQTAWSAMREAQAEALTLSSTAMIVSIDKGDANSLHPRNKTQVANRLALTALQRIYGQKVNGSGPVFESYRTQGSKVVIHFSNCGKGLELQIKKGNTEFEIADIKGQRFPAEAEVEGSDLVLWSSYVVNPTEVRYAWRNCPSATLFNSDHLPAAPFKLDIRARQ